MIGRIVGNLRVDANRNSRVVRLTFRAPDPQLAADVANALARLHVEQEHELRAGAAREATRWLQARIEEQRRQVEASEQSLQSYREKHGATSLEHTYDDGYEPGYLRWAVIEATRERLLREVRYRDLEAASEHPDALDRFPEVLADDYIPGAVAVAHPPAAREDSVACGPRSAPSGDEPDRVVDPGRGGAAA